VANVEWKGYERLQKRLNRMARPTLEDFRPLGEAYEDIITEFNRIGALAGLDKDGQPLAPLKYRNGAGKATGARRGQRFGKAAAAGTQKFGVGGNLTTAQYKKLTGPALAPRREMSRRVANLETGHGQDGSEFFAVGAWKQFENAKGKKILPMHARGNPATNLPVRNIFGVPPAGVAKARRVTRVWVKSLLESK
jgi:hypothetical protein